MDSALRDVSRFLNDPRNLETERQRLQMLIEQQPVACFNGDDQFGGAFVFGNNDPGSSELMASRAIKADSVENWCSDDLGMILKYGNESAFERSFPVPETATLRPSEAASGCGKGKATTLRSATVEDIDYKKRPADFSPEVTEEKPLEKRLKASTVKDSRIAEDNSNKNTTNPTENLKENSKGLEIAKPDYIHVRARRGQATDSHSLAERARRKKISAKMKYLQGSVPGCSKITGEAAMLDEIINYVQSLQRQVQFLSLKLAAITPRMDFSMDGYLAKEMFSAFPYSIPTTIGISSLGQRASCSGLEIGLTAPDVSLRRYIGAPVEMGLDSSCMNQIQHFASDAELQNLFGVEFQQGRSAHFISNQPFTGT